MAWAVTLIPYLAYRACFPRGYGCNSLRDTYDFEFNMQQPPIGGSLLAVATDWKQLQSSTAGGNIQRPDC